MKKNLISNILLGFFVFFFISACSSKEQAMPKVVENNQSTMKVALKTTEKINNDELEEDDEFSDEFETSDKEVYDPLEEYNRWMTSVNDKFFVYIYNPISEGYAYVLPKPARVGVSNAFDNLKFPLRFANNLLQFKFDSSMKELGRFMINSTVGLLGFVDVAKMGGVEPQEEDFGQTLGYYGVGPGFHVVLPFFGPSNLRDTIGLSVDTFSSPLSNGSIAYQLPENFEQALGVSTLYYINKNSLHLGEYENLKKDALDTYTFFRDSYEQKRIKDIEK